MMAAQMGGNNCSGWPHLQGLAVEDLAAHAVQQLHREAGLVGAGWGIRGLPRHHEHHVGVEVFELHAAVAQDLRFWLLI